MMPSTLDNPLPDHAKQFWRAVCGENRKHGSEGGCWKSAHRGNSPAAYPTWYGVEFDGQDTFYGLVIGHEMELGYFSLAELEQVRGPWSLPVERDLYFEPTILEDLKALHQG